MATFRNVILMLIILYPLSIFAQKIDMPTFQTEKIEGDSFRKWTGGGSIGLDAMGVSMINPRVNDGDGRLNAGGLISFWFNYQSKKWIWNNRGSLQMGLSKDEDSDGWMKSTDALMYNTQLGVQMKGKWYWALMVDMQTQLLSTYDGKYLNPISSDNSPRSLTARFFAPATVKFAPGVLWKPKPYFSVLMSAVSNKNIIVADDYLANLVDTATQQSVYGNNRFSNISQQIGAQLRADLHVSFANDRILLNSTLDLYSNYLKSPENVAVEWFSSFDVLATEHLAVSMRSDWYYDHNVLVRVGGSADDLGRRVSIRNTFLLKYSCNF
jgi:hypothetical protein